MNTSTALEQKTHVKQSTSVFFQNIAALAFGVLIVFAVGFLPTSAAHNAAHDTRHTLAFPCH